MCAGPAQVVTGKRVYNLKADSPNLLDEWLRVLQCVLRVKAASPLFTQPDVRPAMRGHVMKVLPLPPFSVLLKSAPHNRNLIQNCVLVISLLYWGALAFAQDCMMDVPCRNQRLFYIKILSVGY